MPTGALMTSSTGRFFAIDGPDGVGTTTVTGLVVRMLIAAGHDVLSITEPSQSPIGELASSGEYEGLTLACLLVADRDHRLRGEVRPALAAGRIVVSDGYVPSALVIQYLDGVPGKLIADLNAEADRPDLTVVLLGDEKTCRARSGAHGVYGRFGEGAIGEVDAYRAVAQLLSTVGFRMFIRDVGDATPQQVADAVFAAIVEELAC
ncbi:dTMP kinase [Actinoplanes sp. CA-054009]